jgi:hypothetical protein
LGWTWTWCKGGLLKSKFISLSFNELYDLEEQIEDLLLTEDFIFGL